MKCDVIADGIIQATKLVDVKVPIVVRLAGTNSEKAAEIIDAFNSEQAKRTDDKKVNLVVVNDFDRAANEVVKQASTV